MERSTRSSIGLVVGACVVAIVGTLSPAPSAGAKQGEPPPAAPSAWVRVIHADASSPRLFVRTCGAPAALAFGAATPFVQCPTTPGREATSIAVDVGRTARQLDAGGEALYRAPSDRATLFVVEQPSDPGGPMATLSAPDGSPAPAAGTTRVRFLNALNRGQAVEVCAGGRSLFGNAIYGEWAGRSDTMGLAARYYPMALAAPVEWEIRDGNADAPCTGERIGTATVAGSAAIPIDAQNVTIALAGRDRGRPARQLLVCIDPPGTSACFSIPVR